MPNIVLSPPSVLDQIVLYPFNVVHPLPPATLNAVYTTDPLNRNTRIVSVTWTPVPSQPDVVSYNVYRNGSKIGNVLSTAVPANQFLDNGTGGEVEFFTYYVTAVDALGIESALSVSICNFSQKTNQFISELRRSLKDNPPDPRVQRWDDDDLWLALRQGMSRVNSIPMNTAFNFDTMPEDLFNYVIVASRLAALRMQSALEAAKEFTMNIGGSSLQISRAGVYNTLITSEESSFAQEIKSIKLNFTMRTVHGEGLLTSALPFRIRTFAPRQYRVR